MSKFYSLIIFLFLVKLTCSQEVSATQKLPVNIFPGKEFLVEVTVNKGLLNGFFRYYLDLPRGYTATPIDTKNGSFKTVDTSIRVVWLIPPPESTFSFSFKVTTPYNAKGNLV